MPHKWNDLGRYCTVCGEFKTWDAYSWKRSKRNKKRTEQKTHQVKQPKCKLCAIQETDRWKEKNLHRRRDLYLTRTYGISENEYNARLLAQNNSCLLCGTEFLMGTFGPDFPVVDHCHTTGIVRGILCNECNRGLGYFHDNPEALKRAAKYITENTVSEKGGCSCLL